MNECRMNCDPPEGGGAERFSIAVFAEVTIYGHTVDAWSQAHYPEDWPATVAGRRRGREYGCWHSVMCPDGETGSQDGGILREITYEQFIEARDRGWPEEPIDGGGFTTAAPIMGIVTFDRDGNVAGYWDSQFGKDSPHDPRKD